jgi:hypothetical protein
MKTLEIKIQKKENKSMGENFTIVILERPK